MDCDFQQSVVGAGREGDALRRHCKPRSAILGAQRRRKSGQVGSFVAFSPAKVFISSSRCLFIWSILYLGFCSAPSPSGVKEFLPVEGGTPPPDTTRNEVQAGSLSSGRDAAASVGQIEADSQHADALPGTSDDDDFEDLREVVDESGPTAVDWTSDDPSDDGGGVPQNEVKDDVSIDDNGAGLPDSTDDEESAAEHGQDDSASADDKNDDAPTGHNAEHMDGGTLEDQEAQQGRKEEEQQSRYQSKETETGGSQAPQPDKGNDKTAKDGQAADTSSMVRGVRGRLAHCGGPLQYGRLRSELLIDGEANEYMSWPHNRKVTAAVPRESWR